ncbi:hypothetical protein N0V95_005348 [Ascochyta clinopodiicola]|nr:hypothetical protein N0V95_005348 [Ascochyta clinopodiicola]
MGLIERYSFIAAVKTGLSADEERNLLYAEGASEFETSTEECSNGRTATAHFRAPKPFSSLQAWRPRVSIICSNISQPANTLTPPSADLHLVLIAHGQGTQNYTCATPTSAPSAIGAIAELSDASCEVANPSEAQNSVIQAATIGNHFFADLTTPDFVIAGLGNTKTKKIEEVAAPNPGTDIKWLRLQAQASDSTSQVKFIYRLKTVGGLAPASCEGRAAGEVVTVPYEAQYWIYA